MAGPNSAPNGDASLVSDLKIQCETHGTQMSKCNSDCKLLRKRDVLARSRTLNTGKTRVKRIGK